MKRINLIFLIAALISILILGACSNPSTKDVVLKSESLENTDDSLINITEKGFINVAVYPETLPNVYKNSDGVYEGFFIDVINAVAQKLDVSINYVEITDEPPVVSLIGDKTADIVINGYTDADTSNANIRWINTGITNHHVIITRNNSNISSKEDLADMKTGVTQNTISQISAQSDIKIDSDKLIKFDNEKKASIALINGGIDALIIEDTYFYYYQRYNLAYYKPLDEILSTHIHYFGVDKNSVVFGDKISEIIADLKADGTMEKLSNKWFNNNIIK